MNEKEYQKVVEEFENYYSKYKDLSSNIILKYRHSYNVANLMGVLADRLYLSKEDYYLAKTIGLLHDLGRFEQLKRFDSFNDKLLDHAKYATTYLFDEGHIRDFIDDDKNDNIIKEAIYNHNLIEINDGLNDRELFFSKMIRDMDKVDIYYQLGVIGNQEFIEEPTKEIVDKFFKKENIKHDSINNKSDHVVNIFAFLFNIYFDESLEILRETDNFGIYISSIEVSDKQEELFNKMKDECYKIIGIESF